MGSEAMAIGREGYVFMAVGHQIEKLSDGGLAPPLCSQSSPFADLASMLTDPHFTDVSFKVGGATISAHKAILVARSNYFHTMFLGGLKEAGQEEVEIRETTPAAFRALLKFIYTDNLSFDE